MGHFSRIIGPVAIAALAAPVTVQAADDVDALRAEIAALKAEYAQRVTALEARIDQLETTATVAAVVPVEPPPPAPSAPARTSSAFNPAISVILAGNYADLSQDPADFNFAGFMPSGGEIGPGERSFNLGESEVTVAASVDPYFTAALTVALSGDAGDENFAGYRRYRMFAAEERIRSIIPAAIRRPSASPLGPSNPPGCGAGTGRPCSTIAARKPCQRAAASAASSGLPAKTGRRRPCSIR